ncbi:MAG: endonuclease/exonuclease/phosphatase family protein [Clostridiales Family XIII bacterium]|jgi:endonuclease/exonuclease/phosphatase family metal-dependent hydrolase|nr:endonuclease/exonuclease/phosphatase family protein [Clostridiales Family XIII bacterium]
MKAKVIRPVLKILLIVVIAAVVIVGGYVAYVVLTYERIADNEQLEVNAGGNEDLPALTTGSEYTALTYNIGFGAYDHDFSFFMDEGTMADGTETVGTESRAASEAAVVRNTEACMEAALAEKPDILLFQEVDVKADRSYKVDQRETILGAMETSYAWTFASNFHSAYLFYPPTKPIGKIAESGLLTVSRFGITDAVRRSYPVSDAFPTKFFDLDRCFAVQRLPVEGASGGELVLINTHMSAYDEGGTIRRAQMELLGGVIADEYAKGNWVIVGGDFNHALGGSESKFMNGMKTPAWVQSFDEGQLPEHCRMVIAENNDSVATDRDSSIPYEKGVNYEVTLDGFIVTDNVEASSVNIDADYVGSDHNPVKLTFKLLSGAAAGA